MIQSFFKKTSLGFPGLVFLVSVIPAPDLSSLRADCKGIKTPAVQSWYQVTSNAKAWRGLLHYFDSDQSDAKDDYHFFLSPKGKTDAEAELRATVCEMLSPTQKIEPLKVEASCAFPARNFWLRSIGVPVPETQCTDFLEFIKGINPQSLTYVYSSAYPNNPASMFGHTFIRINQGKQDPLLDYGVNYAALVKDGEPGYLYIPGGLFGWYQGVFQIAPYYRKVLEYTQAESRDLWEYDLDFTRAETEQWVRHLFELRFFARFKYSFLFQNCSYQLLRSLQAIRPVYESLGSFAYVLPGKTVSDLGGHVLQGEEHVHYRPSLFKIAEHRFELLSEEQKRQFQQAKEDESQIPKLQDPMVLEALTSFYDYEKVQAQENVKNETSERLRLTRVTRAKLGGVTHFEPLVSHPDQTNRPDFAHGTRQFGFIQSQDSARFRSTLGATFRLGLHDLLDRDSGYEQTFGVYGLKADLAWDFKEKKLSVEEAILFKITSLQPIDENHHVISWKVGSAWQRIPFLRLSDSTAWTFMAAPGATFQLKKNRIFAGVFSGAEFWKEQNLSKGYQLFLVPEPWVMCRGSDRLKFLAEAPFRIRHDGSRSFFSTKTQVAYSFSKEAEVRLSYETLDREPAGLLQSSILFFF